MEHAEHLVDLVDENGEIVGTKKRREIQKGTDLHHTVFVVLQTPENKLILGKVPARDDLPNVYAGRLGATAVTIRRHGETADEAALRAVKNELRIDDTRLTNLGDTYCVLPGGYRKYMSVYRGIHPLPTDFSRKDIESLHQFGPEELTKATRNDTNDFTPTLLAVWEKYSEELYSF